jgi:hypothetical protein
MVGGVDLWFDYRKVWAAHPLLLAYAVLIVIVLVLAIVGMVVRGPLLYLFIPALAAAYAHHLMVQKRL